MSQRIRSLGALRRAATHLREPQGSAGEQGWLAAKAGTSVRAELCAPDDAIATRPGRPLIMRASRLHRAVSPGLCGGPHGRFASRHLAHTEPSSEHAMRPHGPNAADKRASYSHGAELRNVCAAATRPLRKHRLQSQGAKLRPRPATRPPGHDAQHHAPAHHVSENVEGEGHGHSSWQAS